MNRKSWMNVGIAALCMGTVVGSIAVAQPAKDPKDPTKTKMPAGDKMPELPKGMTQADMEACMQAATPGPMHAWLAERVGTWSGKCKMWMGPDSEPVSSDCTTTFATAMDGRFVKSETSGEMAGMGPFNGFGLYGYDNVSQKFQSTWIDNWGTGMMTGTGERSSDGKKVTWDFTYNCPMTKKPCKMKEIETFSGKDSFTMEMHGTDPKSGKEFKMMEIAYTRKASASAADKTH
jgi:hypothetical protein